MEFRIGLVGVGRWRIEESERRRYWKIREKYTYFVIFRCGMLQKQRQLFGRTVNCQKKD